VTVRTDPEGHETDALFDLVHLEGAHVLEIGAGDGRLTWRYAHRAARVTAVEPSGAAVARANERLHRKDSSVEFHQAAFEDFAAGREPEAFDVALLSWSLCCMRPEAMVHALEEIHRLLKPVGALIEIDPWLTRQPSSR